PSTRWSRFFATAADLRHVVLFQERPGAVRQAAGRGEEARPSRAGAAVAAVYDQRSGGAGAHLLAAARRPDAQADGRLDARRISTARVFARLHAARFSPAPVA